MRRPSGGLAAVYGRVRGRGVQQERRGGGVAVTEGLRACWHACQIQWWWLAVAVRGHWRKPAAARRRRSVVDGLAACGEDVP